MAIGDALFIMRANDKHIPVTPRVLMKLWEGVRELYRMQALGPDLMQLTIQFRNSSLQHACERIAILQPFIDSKSYPEGARPTPRELGSEMTIGEYITNKDGAVLAIPDAVLEVDETIERFALGMFALFNHNRNVYTAISDRLYHEMADIISFSEVLINEGYHEESNLFTNILRGIFTRKRQRAPQ